MRTGKAGETTKHYGEKEASEKGEDQEPQYLDIQIGRSDFDDPMCQAQKINALKTPRKAEFVNGYILERQGHQRKWCHEGEDTKISIPVVVIAQWLEKIAGRGQGPNVGYHVKWEQRAKKNKSLWLQLAL